jgi:hypothetical protein
MCRVERRGMQEWQVMVEEVEVCRQITVQVVAGGKTKCVEQGTLTIAVLDVLDDADDLILSLDLGRLGPEGGQASDGSRLEIQVPSSR